MKRIQKNICYPKELSCRRVKKENKTISNLLYEASWYTKPAALISKPQYFRQPST